MELSRRTLLSALALAPAARLFGGQDAAKPGPSPTESNPTFSTDVKVVNIFATVRDKKGAIVKNLTKDDFVVEEDGHPQVIRYFSQESNLPLTLGLLVDTSGSVRTVLNDERDASYKFFDRILREDRDLAFVIHFDHQVELLQDLTPSRQKLEKGLDELEVDHPDPQQQGQGGGGGNPGGYPGGGYPGGGRYPGGGGGGYPGRSGRRGGTKLYDAVLLASNELMSKQKGRKALVLLTDGVDNGSKTTLSEAIASAQRADTLAYSILFTGSGAGNFGGLGPGMGRRRGMGYPGGGYPGGGYPGGGYPGGGGYNHADGKKVLQQISQETGGRFFEASHHLPVDKIYAEIEEDLRNQYSIGYTSDQKDGGGAYRRLHVTAKPKNLTVSAREGYYPV
jgi:VWFA-related protein